MAELKKVGSALMDGRTLISSAIAAGIAILTAIISHVTELADGQTILDISSNVWFIVLAGAAVQVLKDVFSAMREPPQV